MKTLWDGVAMKILVVEDEARLAELLRRGLSEEGHTVDVCTTGAQAILQTRAIEYDAMVLDWMLPDQDGLAVVRAVRGRGQSLPVLFLTARSQLGERVMALRSGADDFLVKPFAFEELLARLEALHRRTAMLSGERSIGTATLDARRRALVAGEVEVALTAREYAVLSHLAAHAGEAVPRSELLTRIWGQDFQGEATVVDVYIGYVRAKLKQAAGDSAHIDAVRSVGYRFVNAPRRDDDGTRR